MLFSCLPALGSHHSLDMQSLREFGQLRLSTASDRLVEATVSTSCSELNHQDQHIEGVWQSGCAFTTRNGKAWLSEIDWTSHLARMLSVPEQATKCNGQVLKLVDTWQLLYEQLDIPFDNPASLAFPDSHLSNRDHYRIHYLGAQQEADQWPGFLLLLKLMATASLHIHFIGPEVPKTMNEDYHSLRCPVQQPCKDSSDTAPLTARSQAKSEDATHEHCMQLSFHQGLYHDVQEELVVKHGKADLVFGGNAGLAAYPSWLATLRYLTEAGAPPAIFTDYCEEAAYQAMQVMHSLALNKMQWLPMRVNPFRKPLSCQGQDNNLPSYSNAFMFGMVPQT